MSNKSLQVIVIDPFKQEIRHEMVQNPKSTKDYTSFNDEIYKIMSAGPIHVNCFEAAYLDTTEAKKNDCILVDEEGLLKEIQKQMFFTIPNVLLQPLAGIGVVTGSDSQGNTTEPSLTLEWFKQNVRFHTFQEIQRMELH